ncbi:SDR family oxidoreductase [Archangium primigenium]|uniref:SDR family oxidoreductase n=1 Tax=[Archangium] primigenium TaxID=2792470 RepID=UPI001959E88D|nr:SDR family oxidoreductase [Archangium primigenium]MBM7117246.1 SDR family oxidoreductase [Archangium primigenium]
MTPRILVTGATGNTGRVIVTRLLERGMTVRTANRSGPSPDSATEHVRFDWADASSHEAALEGVDRMYLIAPAGVEDPSGPMLSFLDKALARGVRRVVLLSASAVPESNAGLGAVHRALRERAPEWTVLQPSWFMQNFFDARHFHGGSLQREGVLRTVTGEGRVGFVDARDIAEVAARALADETAHDTAHVITGPEALRYDDVAAVLSRVAGRPIRHEPVDADTAQRYMVASGIPERYARFLVQLDEAIAQGAEARVTPTVERVTGRAPRSFEALAREHAARARA